jgi:uncharacterized protein
LGCALSKRQWASQHNKGNRKMITEFTPWAALIGGGLIGLSSVMLMLLNGRIAGMTAIFAGILAPRQADNQWRLAFLAGAIVAPFAATLFGAEFGFQSAISAPLLAIGGVIVGVGVTYGAGCTSGHGVCGIARLSKRSIVATIVFMASTFVTVGVIRHVIGG